MNDYHNHTNLSYCATPELDLEFYCAFLARHREPETIAITDHSMAVYFPPELAWSWEFILKPKIFDHHREWGNQRLATHLQKVVGLQKKAGLITGLEVEMMSNGQLTYDPAFRKQLQVLIGSVHFLPVAQEFGDSPEKVAAYWQQYVFRLLNTDIDILGHPFRWLAARQQVSDALVKAVVAEARRTGVALELNAHFQVHTDELMLRTALETGAAISFGSDAHSPEQVGDLSYHYQLIHRLGVALDEIRFFRHSP